MSTFVFHGKADLQKKKKCPTLPHLRERIPNKASRNTQCSSSHGIPLQINHTRARVSHIIRDKSKSIPYHAFSLSFPLSLFFPAKTRIKKAICRNLHSNLQSGTDCLEPLHVCFPCIALEYSSSTAIKVTNSTGNYPTTVDQILALYTEAAKHG